MNDVAADSPLLQREVLLHALYEAAELEHNLMCTYLYAAFSLKDGPAEGLSAPQAAAVGRWSRSSYGGDRGDGASRGGVEHHLGAGRGTALRAHQFPARSGLPAGQCDGEARALQRRRRCSTSFSSSARTGSTEADGDGFAYERAYTRGAAVAARLTPMGINYDTVGDFYAALGAGLKAFVARNGEPVTFDGDRALQLSPAEVALRRRAPGHLPEDRARGLLRAIVEQGEGAPQDSADSHYQNFIGIRSELQRAAARQPALRAGLPRGHQSGAAPAAAAGRARVDREHRRRSPWWIWRMPPTV